MKGSNGEGVASHTGVESCAGGREAVGEALTGGKGSVPAATQSFMFVQRTP